MEVSGQLHAQAPIGSRPGCALEAVWIMWSTETSLVATGNRTSASQPVPVHTGSIDDEDDDDDGSSYYYFNFFLSLP
jgi:hypothetical protein